MTISVHDDIHSGVAATQKRIKLEAWCPGYSCVEEYIKRCKKCKELRHFTQTTFMARKSGAMDHACITRVGLSLILVDSFSGWPEVIRVPSKKSSTIKKVLRVIFFGNGIPKTLVSDNAPEFCDKDFNLWLEKIGCKLYKTPPYHPQSNGLTERMVQTVKIGLKACSQQKEKNRSFSIKTTFKLSHNTTHRKTRNPTSFNGKANQSSANNVVFHE